MKGLLWLLCLLPLTLSLSPIGTVHYEESYQILHGQLDTYSLGLTLDKIANYGIKLINDTVTINKKTHPNSIILIHMMGTDLIARAHRLHGNLNTAMFSLEDLKRGLDFLGDWIHQLTGVPGPYEHEKEKSAINHIRTALETQAKLNQMVGNDVTNIMKKMEYDESLMEKITHHFDDIYEKVSNFESDIEQCIHLLAMKLRLDSMISQIQLKIEDFHQIVMESKMHFLSSQLINATSLRTKVQMISADARELTPIIPYTRSSMYYALPTTRAVFLGNSVHVFTRIPMIRPDQTLTLHPISYESSFQHQHDYDYLLTNKKNTFFSTMTTNQLSRCLEIKGIGLVADIRPVEIDVSIENCTTVECACLICHVTQIRLNTFSFKAPMNTIATIYCNNNDSTTETELTTRGIFKLPADCSLKTKYFFVHRVIAHENSRYFSYEPTIELQDLSYLFPTNKIHQTHLEKLNISISQLNSSDFAKTDLIAKLETETEEIKIDSSTHWGLSITSISLGAACIIGLCVLLLAIYLVRKKVRDNRNQNLQLAQLFELTERARAGI